MSRASQNKLSLKEVRQEWRMNLGWPGSFLSIHLALLSSDKTNEMNFIHKKSLNFKTKLWLALAFIYKVNAGILGQHV